MLDEVGGPEARSVPVELEDARAADVGEWARERSRDERSKEEGQVPQTLETALVAVMVEELLKKNKDLQEQAARWMEEKKKEVSHLGQKWWNRQHQRGDQEER